MVFGLQLLYFNLVRDALIKRISYSDVIFCTLLKLYLTGIIPALSGINRRIGEVFAVNGVLYQYLFFLKPTWLKL